MKDFVDWFMIDFAYRKPFMPAHIYVDSDSATLPAPTGVEKEQMWNQSAAGVVVAP